MSAIHTSADIDDPSGRHPGEQRTEFVFDVDGTTYEHNHPTITGAEIMAIAGISSSNGLIQILPDGTRKTIAPDETVHLVPGAQFKRRPRFKRG
ncbi:hypothetical protein DMA12_41980 [Amycolatopsis balhimycina DSM 5908]|uniref:Multi-ubiquitin domain-containing protein n=1 Tax=Amycolatopsis balhimycina DSM 5908 TaxID=1081091 RepID=A0A428VZ09_AMYBA|nr:multiubiquitin domain-containing protein [Amycolatopsis balhimycina]RSM36046.1 hypothetical protein DMA12_41980 [Amycolatopsis balhimycina DSM 5908]